MTVKNITTLRNDVNAALADNTNGDISPLDVRSSVIDTIDSMENVAINESIATTVQIPQGGGFVAIETVDLPSAGTYFIAYKVRSLIVGASIEAWHLLQVINASNTVLSGSSLLGNYSNSHTSSQNTAVNFFSYTSSGAETLTLQGILGITGGTAAGSAAVVDGNGGSGMIAVKLS